MESKSQHRCLSPVIMRYMTAGFAVPFVCSLLGFTALFLLLDIFDDMSDFMSHNVSVGLSVLYFLARQPQNMTNVVPISSLLAASFMTLMLGRHNELTAMRAAGMSLMACNMPAWIISALACVAVFAVNEFWGPACSKYADRIFLEHVKKDKASGSVDFHHWNEHRDWHIEKLNLDGESNGIIVRQYRSDGSGEYLLTAQSAEYIEGTGWIFKNGFEQTYAGGELLGGEQKFFESMNKNFDETPQVISSHSVDWNLMCITELWSALKSGMVVSKRERQLMKTMLWHRMTFPLAALVSALFGVALTISTDRMGLMKGFAFAVGMLVLFYLANELFMVLAKNGWVPSFVGGALPSLAFLVMAVFTMWKKQ